MVTDASRSTWTPKEISRLGTKADDELAAILGRSLESVRRKRQKLETEAPLQPAWAPEEIRLLGTKPDREVAKLVGRSPVAVQLKRLQLGIQSWRAKSTKQRGAVDAERIKLLFGPIIRRAPSGANPCFANSGAQSKWATTATGRFPGR